MKAKCLFHLSLVTLFIIGMVASGISVISSAETATVYIDPPLTSAQPDQYFTVNITVANVTDLKEHTIYLSFKSSILYTNETMIKEGPFLSNAGPTDFKVRKEYAQWIIGNSLMTGGVDGSGILANVTFRVETEGFTHLQLWNTALKDSASVDIDHTTYSGFFSNVNPDVAVMWPVTFPEEPPGLPQKAPFVVSVGEPVLIDVTVKNLGNETIDETFDVTVYYNSTTIETQTATGLNPGVSEVLRFVWDTTGLVNGTYFIVANASVLGGETITDNNSADAVRPIKLTLAPAARFTYSPASPIVDETVTFNATTSLDPDGNIVSYEWDFDDGNVTTVTDPIITHVYNSARYYSVSLTVKDNDNLTDTQIKSVPIGTPDIPVINEIEVDGQNFIVITTTNSSISPVPFNIDIEKSEISFNVSGPEGMTGYCNVSIPKSFMNCPDLSEWKVNVNTGFPTYFPTPTENTTHTFVYFAYATSTHTIRISSTNIVPEFPTFVLLLLFIIATVAATTIAKKSWSIGHNYSQN